MDQSAGQGAETSNAESTAVTVSRADRPRPVGQARRSIDLDGCAVSVILAVKALADLVMPDLLWAVAISMASVVLSEAAEQRLPWPLFVRVHALLAVLMFVASASAAGS